MPAILETSSNTQTKYIALQIMDRLIKTRWKVLPEEQRDIERLVKVENSLQDARYRNRSATRLMEDLLEG